MSFALSHPGEIAWRLGQHLALTALTLLVASAIALPLGILATWHQRLRNLLLPCLDVVYTIPSLALYALLIPLLGLGFTTALTALVLYTQMILVRNVVAGLSNVPTTLRDCALGLGMSPIQSLLLVELPYAMPIILGGMRVATITLIAMVNLAAWINAGGLGTLIFYGLQHDDPNRVIVGSACSAFLAITADAGFRKLEVHADARQRSVKGRSM